MIPVKHIAPKILKIMAVNYCGCHIARRLGWAAPAYHEKEGGTPHPGVRKHSLQYDGRPDERFWLRVWTWNLGSLCGNGGDVCGELRRGMIDLCNQQVRWRR